jgi:tetratricopeptide (TPR) repeat protein
MKAIGTIFFLAMVQLSVGQDCNTMAANKPTTVSRGLDAFVAAVTSNQKPGSYDITSMRSPLGKVESWIKNLLTGFTGAKASYSNDYYLDYQHEDSWSGNFYKATGIKGFYGTTTRFFAYYCYDNNNKIQTEGESGSFVHVNFNNVFAGKLATYVDAFTVNGKPVFLALEKSHSEGRVDFYDLRKRMDYNDTTYTSKSDIIIIRNSDKPVFIPIARKEYLQQMLKDIEIYRAKQKEMFTGNYKNSIKAFEDEMKAYKNDKNYTPEKETKRRRWFEEDQEKVKKVIDKIDPDVNASKEVIMRYLGKPTEWLGRGLGSFYTDAYTPNGLVQYLDRLDIFSESKDDYTRLQMVSINPAYFNNTLPATVPQLILVELDKNGYRYMYKLATLVKKPGALAPLEAMLNPGKSAPHGTPTPAPVSNYTLKYLPKLDRLTPINVPADMKPSAVPVINNYNSIPAAAFSFEIPALSPKLNQLPQLATTDNYKTYTQQLYTAIAGSIKPEEKKKADDYVQRKKIIQPKDIGKTAFAAWLQNTPRTSLYLYSKAIVADPSDALTANNFAAFLMMGGLPERSIPILEYWNKQKPGEATLLCNLGNAYYRLGDSEKATRYLQQCVQYDSLNPTANKILCLMYLKKGDTKKAEEHGTRSVTKSHDEQVIAILRQLNKKVKPGEIMGRLQKKEFPLLKRIGLPAMPSGLDDMEQFIIELGAEKRSIDMTIESIESKMPEAGNTVAKKIPMAGFAGGIPSLRAKAQYIIMDAMQIYQQDKVREADVFRHQLKLLASPYNSKISAISKKYAVQLNKLKGGEAGDEDEIAALEMARCKEMNGETQKYLTGLSSLVNGYAQRQEFISRKFYRDYANWTPYWMPQAANSFLSVQRDYLKDIAGILSEYKTVTKMNCGTFQQEPLTPKNGVLKEWEDEYCANFKGKIGMGPVKVSWTCNSWGVEGGEGIVGEFEMNFVNGAFEGVTIGGGLGATWKMGDGEIITLEAGTSIKEFIKIGPNKATGKWEVADFGMKTEAGIEGGIGKVTGEIKLIELSVAVNAGLEVGGALAPVLPLK